jgi:hypothetical protein
MHSPAKESGRLTPRPEQTFFTDPALDRAMGVVMALVAWRTLEWPALRARKNLEINSRG